MTLEEGQEANGPVNGAVHQVMETHQISVNLGPHATGQAESILFLFQCKEC